MSQLWFIRRDSSETGPHLPAALKQFACDGTLGPNDEVRRDDRDSWVRAGNVRGLFETSAAPLSKSVMKPAAAQVLDVPQRQLPQSVTSPLSPTASDHRVSRAEMTAAVADLYRNSFDNRFFGDPAVLRNDSLTPKKREGIATYAGLGGDEVILLAVDTTIFGVATEGFALTDRAIAWSFPDGNRGRVRYDSFPARSAYMDSGSGGPQRLCFGSSSKRQVPCKSLRHASVVAMADFLATAARVAQGLRPEQALPRARQLAAAGECVAAVALWKALLEDDLLEFPTILAEVSQARSERISDAALDSFQDELATRASDREAGWLLPRLGDQPQEVTSDNLASLWRSGALRRESQLRHLSELKWKKAGDVPLLQQQRTVYVAETGVFVEEQFLACIRGLAAEGLSFDELLVFGPTSAKIDDAPGNPILHVGLTDGELILSWLPAEGPAIVERSPAIGVVWKRSEQYGGHQIELATAKRSATFTLPPGEDTSRFLNVASELFLKAAEESLAEHRRTEVSRLLERIVVTESNRQRVDQLREQSRAEEEVLCVYEGGHPDHVDTCLGTLRLDSDGFEFMSIAPESQVCFRVPYERVVDFASPQRGAMPADIQKSMLGPNGLLSAGLGVAAACVIPGGAMLVRSLSGMAGDVSTGPPLNRLTAVTSLSGTPYKIYFDVVGETIAEMSQKAKSFWSRTAKMKSRFLKPGATSTPPRTSDVGDPEVKVLLREIRDSLQMVLKVLSLDLAASRRRESSVLATAQLEALRQSLGAQLAGRLGLPASPITPAVLPPKAIVIACPKCGVRIRAERPGVIKCSSCKTLARLGPNLFSPRPAVPPLVVGHGVG